jgi:hypothetical protein
MMPARKSRSKQIIQFIASVKLTSICLLALILLVIWGTLYQVDHGLYQAQQKIFHSWIILAGGFFPLPGTTLVMFILFVNLLFAIYLRIGLRLKNIGNLITHLGLVLLLVGTFVIRNFSLEANVIIGEGNTVNEATVYSSWEMALWRVQSGSRKVYAFDTRNLRSGDTIPIAALGITIEVDKYYSNSLPLSRSVHDGKEAVNASGIRGLREQPPAGEKNRNVAGGIFTVTSGEGSPRRILLYGNENFPTRLTIEGLSLYFSLRPRKIQLPFQLTLRDFQKILYPNSTIPKSFKSKITLSTGQGVDRDVVISMNRPLRYEGYTLFQSSFFTAEDGTEHTVLALNRSPGRIIPYYSCIFIFLGMVIHFILLLMKKKSQET